VFNTCYDRYLGAKWQHVQGFWSIPKKKILVTGTILSTVLSTFKFPSPRFPMLYMGPPKVTSSSSIYYVDFPFLWNRQMNALSFGLWFIWGDRRDMCLRIITAFMLRFSSADLICPRGDHVGGTLHCFLQGSFQFIGHEVGSCPIIRLGCCGENKGFTSRYDCSKCFLFSFWWYGCMTSWPEETDF